MTALIPTPKIEHSTGEEERIDEAELAAAAFLARYQGRTLEAYRYDLRAFFQWSGDAGLVILSATRAQIELYVRAMEGRGLAATTMDRRLSTVCGFYRFAHIDGRIASNPAQYVRRGPRSTPVTPAASTARSWAPYCSPPRASTTPMPRLPCSSG